MIKSLNWIALAVLLCSCAKQKNVPDQIDDLFSSEFKASDPGAAVLVMNNGQVIFEKGYGVADIETKEKVTPATLFNVGSITKTFVSNTILLLAAEGKLNVNDSLSLYFKD